MPVTERPRAGVSAVPDTHSEQQKKHGAILLAERALAPTDCEVLARRAERPNCDEPKTDDRVTRLKAYKTLCTGGIRKQA